ncbi:MAG: hypothetical protein IJK12_08855 [Clostridia bacterium]|nr:hypothetical protein [Clostridia bacterium]
MRKRTIDKLLQAAIVEQAAEQGELWDREPVLEPIPEESQKRFDAALYGEPPKQTGAEDFFGQPAPKPAPEPKRRRVLAFALTGVSIAAVVLVVGLMIGVSRGEKGIKPDVLAPVHPDAQSTNAPPAGAGVHPADATAPGLAEPTDTPTPEPGAAGESRGPAFILNGKERNVYTSHYFIEDEETSIPLNAFLASVGAVAVDSPYNRYMVQCYEIQGIRYIYDWESQVFALEEPYDEIVQKQKAEGRTPTEADFREIDLFAQEGYEPEMQAETWLDHRILERVLRKMGLDISIEIDREANAIRVELADKPEAAEPLRAEDLIGTWNKWQADNVDFSDQFTLREDGTATRTQRLYSEQEYEGTYSVRDDAALLTFGAVTQQAVCDPKADVMLLFDSPLSWLSYYRDSRNDIKEHWFEIKWETLPNKTIAQEELSGVWELKRAESAFASVDLSGLSGFLTFVQGKLPQMRVQMQLAGRGVSVTRYYELDDSVLYVENEDQWGNILMANEAILDPDTNELKLCYVWTKRPLTRADSVLVFEKLPEAEEVLTREGLVGTWKLYGGMLYSAGGQMTLFFREDGTVQIRSKKDGIFTTSDMDSYSIVDNTVHFYKDGEEYRPFGDDELWFGTGMLIVSKPSDSLWSASFYRCSPQSF